MSGDWWNPATPTSASGPSPQVTLVEVQPQDMSPAKFEVRNLTVNPVLAKPGEIIFINYEVINTDGQSGEFAVKLVSPVCYRPHG